jgi:transcriptional regulator with XRE-family HTH domain
MSTREAHDWRLGELATAVGISSAYLANIEAGRKRLRPVHARRIASLLGVRLLAIMNPAYMRNDEEAGA